MLVIDINILPEIDFLIISHDHYDHLDYKTINKIDYKVKKYIVPLGCENHLRRFGINKSKIQTFAWWEELEINGLKICCTPARHFSGRKLIDSNTTLWSSWTLIDKYHKVFLSGDSGYGKHFKEINARYGDFDLAFLENGQYNQRWPQIHMFPEQTFLAATDLKTKYIVPIHWESFVLSNHGFDDSVERIIKFKKSINIIIPQIGEMVEFKGLSTYKNTYWWKNLK